MITEETLEQVVKTIIKQGEMLWAKSIHELESEDYTKADHMKWYYEQANEATIFFKMALKYKYEGINSAIKYFEGTHSIDEYKEFLDGDWKSKLTDNDRKRIKKFVIQLNEMEHENGKRNLV
jgi:hypothetical protein